MFDGLRRWLSEALWTDEDVVIDSPRSEDIGWTPLYKDSESIVPDYKREVVAKWSKLLAGQHLAGRFLDIFYDFIIGDNFRVYCKPVSRDQSNIDLVSSLNDNINEWMNANNFTNDKWRYLYGKSLIGGEVNVLLKCENGNVASPIIDDIDTIDFNEYSQGRLGDIVNISVPITVLDGTYSSSEEINNVTLKVIDNPENYTFQDHEYGLIARTAWSPEVHPRGVGLLFNLIDKLRLDDDFLEADNKRAIMAGLSWMDVTVRGGKAQVNEAKKLVGSWPSFGSVRVHNHNVQMEQITPRMGLYESSAGHKMNHQIMAGSKGIPLFFLGTGEDTNRASAEQMSLPTHKHLKRRQGDWKHFVVFLMECIIECRRQQGMIKVDKDQYTIEVETPDLSPKDAESVARAVGQVLNDSITAENARFISHETAQAVYVEQLRQMTDLDVDVEIENDMIEQSKQEADQQRIEDTQQVINEMRNKVLFK